MRSMDGFILKDVQKEKIARAHQSIDYFLERKITFQ